MEGLVRVVLSGIVTLSGMGLVSKCSAQALEQPAFSMEDEAALEEVYRECLSDFDKQRVFNPYIFSSLTEKAPDNPNTHMILGNALSLSQFVPDNYQRAIEEFDKALAINPDIASVYVNRGLAHYLEVEPKNSIPKYMITGENMPEEFVKGAQLAIKDFDKAIKLNPLLFSAYFNKGVILKRIGKEKEAVPVFEKAIKLGLDKKAHSAPSVADEDGVEILGTGHPMMAMSQLREYAIDQKLNVKRKEGKIVTLSRANPFISNENDAIAFAYYHQGTALASANMREYSKALKCLDKAITLNPDVPAFYSAKRTIYAGLGEADKMFDCLYLHKKLIDKMSSIRNSPE